MEWFRMERWLIQRIEKARQMVEFWENARNCDEVTRSEKIRDEETEMKIALELLRGENMGIKNTLDLINRSRTPWLYEHKLRSGKIFRPFKGIRCYFPTD